MNCELRIIMATTRVHPYRQKHVTDVFFNNYALFITNYELIMTRTSVRLYVGKQKTKKETPQCDVSTNILTFMVLYFPIIDLIAS